MQLHKEAWKRKKFRTSTRFQPVTSRFTGAMLYQLSYEVTDVGSRSIVGSYVNVKEMIVNDIWNKSYMNCGNEMKKWSSQWTQFMQCIWAHNWPAPNVSGFIVHLVEHRTGNREVTGSNPVEVLNFFSGFFTQLHKLRSLRRSFLHFHFISVVHIWFISYMINTHFFHGNIWTHNWPAPNVSGFIAQLVEDRTGKSQGHGFKPCWSPEFFFRLLYAIA